MDFVWARLEESSCIGPPRGIKTPPGICLKWNKSPYGLTGAPRLWYRSFSRSSHDCMYLTIPWFQNASSNVYQVKLDSLWPHGCSKNLVSIFFAVFSRLDLFNRSMTLFVCSTRMLDVLYVDVLGVAARSTKLIYKVVEELNVQGFSLTWEGSFSEFLGIKANRSDNGDI